MDCTPVKDGSDRNEVLSLDTFQTTEPKHTEQDGVFRYIWMANLIPS